MLEDFADRFQRHAFDIRVEEDDEQPAEEADTAVEAECSGRCDALHHGEESTADDDVGAPATVTCVSKGVPGAFFSGAFMLTYVTVLSMVPSALASLGINSVPIHAMVATPVE